VGNGPQSPVRRGAGHNRRDHPQTIAAHTRVLLGCSSTWIKACPAVANIGLGTNQHAPNPGAQCWKAVFEVAGAMPLTSIAHPDPHGAPGRLGARVWAPWP